MPMPTITVRVSRCGYARIVFRQEQSPFRCLSLGLGGTLRHVSAKSALYHLKSLLTADAYAAVVVKVMNVPALFSLLIDYTSHRDDLTAKW